MSEELKPGEVRRSELAAFLECCRKWDELDLTGYHGKVWEDMSAKNSREYVERSRCFAKASTWYEHLPYIDVAHSDAGALAAALRLYCRKGGTGYDLADAEKWLLAAFGVRTVE